MINNRQNGRRRGRSGNAPRPNGGGGQPDRGSRLDNRARGNASQLHEKYKTLAADAQRQGDRVMTEYYLQFADHYFRVLSENRSRFEDQQQRRDRFDGQSDDFDEADGEQAEGFEERSAERGPRGQDWERGEAEGNRDGYRERGRNDGNRGDGNRAERGDGGREPMRGLEGPRAGSGRDRSERGEEAEQGGPREPRQPRDGYEQRAQRPRRGERQDAEPAQPAPAVAESMPAVPLTSIAVEAAPTPAIEPAPAAELPLDAPVPERRPRGRPRKVVAVEASAPQQDGGQIEMDRLPPALIADSVAAEVADAAAAEPKPRRTRRPRGETATA